MIFSRLVQYFTAVPKENRHQTPANSSGFDQTQEFRSFLQDVRPIHELDSGSDTASGTSQGG